MIRQRGFSLIEVLVVISIIGMLMALIVPAVQQAREGGRRTQCANNFHQLSLAMANFESARGHYPTGDFKGPDSGGPKGKCWSWTAQLLGYLEHSDVVRSGDIPRVSLAESAATKVCFPMLLCPTESAPLEPRLDAGNLEGLPVGRTSYKAVSGSNWGMDAGKMLATSWTHKGTNGSLDGLAEQDGMLGRSDFAHPRRIADVTDGSSTTFLLGEDVNAENVWLSWPYANNAYGTCAIPPNTSPGRGSGNKDWQNTWSFRSWHPGGLQFAFADGHLKFIDEGIDIRVYRALATVAGHELATNP